MLRTLRVPHLGHKCQARGNGESYYLLTTDKHVCWGGWAPTDPSSQHVNPPAGRCGSTAGPIRRGVGRQSLLVGLSTVCRLVGSEGYPTFLPRNHELWGEMEKYRE